LARHTFGGGSSDWAFTWNTDGSIAQAPGVTLTFWDSLVGGAQYPAAPLPGGVDDGTGLLDGTGTPTASVTCDANGEIPDSLQGPDGIYRMAADASGGTGPRRWLYANDIGTDLTTLAGDVAPLAAMQLAPYVYYDPDTASYPLRPDTTSSVVWWVGPVAPTLGGTGGALPTDVWLNTTSGIAPGGVTSVTAADGSVTVDNTNPDTPLVKTSSLDIIATEHPPTATVPMNSQTLSNLADGVSPQDAATVSQLSTVTLDSTSTDIQPAGTQSAGSLGSVARADHIHPWVIIPTGVKTAAYTAAPYDLVRVNTSGGAVTITLPNGPADRIIIGVKVITSGNTCTIAAAGTDVFNVGGGATTYLLSRAETVLFQYVSTNKVWLSAAHSQGLSFDSTATDIQPAGNQAAGAKGLMADAGHVHPAHGWMPADHGLAAWVYDPMLIAASTAPTSGTIYLLGLKIRQPVTVSKLYFALGGTPAAGVTAGENFAGLYSSTALLASAATDASFGGALGSLVTCTITAQALTPGQYWVAFLMNATTMPTLGDMWGATGQGGLYNLGLTAASYRIATGGTGATTLPGTTPALSSGGKSWWTAAG
jgi:hypothetical protein